MKVNFKPRSEEVIELSEWINKNLELKNRKDENKWRRYYMMKYLKKRYKFSTAVVGSFFGKDHSTVLNALKQYNVLEGFADFQETIHDLKMRFPLDEIQVENISASETPEMLGRLEVEFHRLQKQVKNELL